MDDTIPKAHENFNESIEEMEERLSYMPVGSPGYVKLSEKINHYSGSSEYSESSERRTPENHQIPESIQVSERHSESNQLPESEHSDFQTNNFQNQESVFQTQLVSQSFQSQNAGAESTLFQHNSLEKEHSHESIDPMMEISIQEQLKREDCDSLGSASCVSMTSSDNEAEYSPLAPSTMNLTQIGNATFKSVGSEVEIMRESVLDEEEEEEENEEIRNVESKSFDTFEQEDGDDGLESYELIGKSPSVNSMQATEDSYERQPEYAEALLPSISNTQISNAEYEEEEAEEESQLEIVSPEPHQQSENTVSEDKTTNLEEDPSTMQNHSYYFGGDDEYLDQMQDAIMESQQMPVEDLMQRSRSSSKSEGRLEMPGALSLNTSSHEALAAEVPETYEEETTELEQVELEKTNELDYLTDSSEKLTAQAGMNTFQTELDEEPVDYSLKNDSTTTLNTVYSQGDRFSLDNKTETSNFDETNEYSVAPTRETEMSEVRSSAVTVSPYNSSAESVVAAAIEKEEGGEHESVIATSKPEEEAENKYNGDQEAVVVQECNIATTAVDTTLVSDYSGVDIETAVDKILENQVESQELLENTREIIVETKKEEAEKFLEMDGDLLDLNNEDKMEYVSDVQDCAKELVENSVQPELEGVDLIEQYDPVNNNNFDSYQQEEELSIPEPEIRFTEMQEPLENAMRPQTSSSSTSPPPSTSDPESRSHSSTSTDSSKSHAKLQKRWSQEKFIEIVNWHDLRESSVVMVSLMSFIILLMKYPILYLLTNIILTIATGAFFIKIYGKVMSLVKGGPQPDPFEKYLKRESFVTEASVQKYLIKFSKVVFPAIAEIQHLVLGTDLRQSVVFWIKLYFLSHVTSWFTGLTVLLWSVILAFSLPMIYKKNKVLVDANLCLVNKIYEDSVEKIGKSVGGVMKKFKSD